MNIQQLLEWASKYKPEDKVEICLPYKLVKDLIDGRGTVTCTDSTPYIKQYRYGPWKTDRDGPSVESSCFFVTLADEMIDAGCIYSEAGTPEFNEAFDNDPDLQQNADGSIGLKVKH